MERVFAIISGMDGSQTTVLGREAEYLYKYFRDTCGMTKPKLDWILVDDIAINLAYAIRIEFKEAA